MPMSPMGGRLEIYEAFEAPYLILAGLPFVSVGLAACACVAIGMQLWVVSFPPLSAATFGVVVLFQLVGTHADIHYVRQLRARRLATAPSS